MTQGRRQLVAHVCALLAILALPRALAADGIRATVNRPEASIEDQILLTLTVEGSRSARPELPDLSDFEVFPRGQSTQMSFVNGRVTSSISFNYLLVPQRTGTLTIGAATVELDGETYASEPITVRIVAASEQPQEARELFVTAKVSTTTPVVGQEVLYIWRFYRRVRIGDARLEPQEFRGFLVEDLGEVREYQATVNGVQYLVSEIRKALFPQEAGALTIPASRLTLEVLVRRNRATSPFDDLFGTAQTQTKVLRSRAIDLQVAPLPDPPATFSGLVGSFDIQAQLSKVELKVGESATLKLTISGYGNVQMISEPNLPELPDFKVYDDRPTSSVERSGPRLSGSRTFSKALVPLSPGERVVPPVELTFFDPEAGQFRSVGTAAIPLRVTPSEGREDLNLTESVAPTTGKVAVRILADDLLPIHTELAAVRAPWDRRFGSGVVWSLMLAPPLAFVVALAIQRRRHRFAQDEDLRRRHGAMRQLRRELRRSGGSTDDGSALRTASLALRRYIGDKLGVEGGALTPEEVDQHLRQADAGDEAIAQARALLERLEAAHFGGQTVTADEAATQVLAIAKVLERQIR